MHKDRHHGACMIFSFPNSLSRDQRLRIAGTSTRSGPQQGWHSSIPSSSCRSTFHKKPREPGSQIFRGRLLNPNRRRYEEINQQQGPISIYPYKGRLCRQIHIGK